MLLQIFPFHSLPWRTDVFGTANWGSWAASLEELHYNILIDIYLDLYSVHTFRETDMEHENASLEKEKYLPTTSFGVPC